MTNAEAIKELTDRRSLLQFCADTGAMNASDLRLMAALDVAIAALKTATE